VRYLSTIVAAEMVIGNSSSGLTEVPLLRRPTVNIGTRQGGRLRAPSVIDCDETTDSIVAAIQKARSEAHQKICAQGLSVYGHGDASTRILEVLRTVDPQKLLLKSFYDLKETE
jgi:UDP-N-acetylglucosamine 2-epimerase